MNSLVYLTRRCPRNCGYCDLKSNDFEGELTLEQWVGAFLILKQLDIEFNLILGNETWLLGHKLYTLMQINKVPYALYTTTPKDLFTKYAENFFLGPIDNLSCGVDYSWKYIKAVKGSSISLNDMEKKTRDAYRSFRWVKKHFPNVDCQGTMTVHRQNMWDLPDLVRDLSSMGVFVGLNMIHWDKDGGFDFFPKKEKLFDYMFREKDLTTLQDMINEAKAVPHNLIQNPEYLENSIPMLTSMGWHCNGDPYGGPTIDADGSLRCCGYRKGEHTSEMKIWDLPYRFREWKERVKVDALECPGCVWSYPMVYHYHKNTPEFRKDVFVRHAGKHIPAPDWSKRRIT